MLEYIFIMEFLIIYSGRQKNCHPAQYYSEKSYKIGFTSSIAMNIMKLGNTVVLGLVETILSYFFELGWLVFRPASWGTSP